MCTSSLPHAAEMSLNTVPPYRRDVLVMLVNYAALGRICAVKSESELLMLGTVCGG